MSGYWWVVLLAGLAVVLLIGFAFVKGRSAPEDAHALLAEPEDRPLPAVVANPTKVEADTRRQVISVCTSLGWSEPLWLETTVDDPGTGQAHEAVRRGADVVLACGGDGTVRAVAEALAGSGVAMALVPAGTGNLLARTIGTPQDVAAATRVALAGDDRKIDVGRVRVDDAEHDRVFLVMAGTGFDAAIMANTPERLKVRVGPLAYVISGLRGLRGRRTRVELTLDGEAPLRRRTRTVLVGNSGTLLGGLVLMPRATIDDGLLDVVNIAPSTFVGWVAVAVRVITRRRGGHERVEHWQAKSIIIESDAPQPSQLDGDPIGDVTKLEIRVDPAVLVMRVPVPPSPDAPGPGIATAVRTIYVIGIGAGDPEHLTLQAIAAMNRVDVFFTVDKGAAKDDLAGLRTSLLERHVTRAHRVVSVPDPERDRSAGSDAYAAAVQDWQDRREAAYEQMITEELTADGTGGFLVWGDPALYDGTLRILDRIAARGAVAFDVVSVPGISSVQALAAQHRVALNRTGRAFTVTTGRRLAAEGMPAGVDDVVVMLDARQAFAQLPDTDLDIYWGAYVGTTDELLVSGDLQLVKDEITALWAEHRARKGWIMDSYLLRRRTTG